VKNRFACTTAMEMENACLTSHVSAVVDGLENTVINSHATRSVTAKAGTARKDCVSVLKTDKVKTVSTVCAPTCVQATGNARMLNVSVYPTGQVLTAHSANVSRTATGMVTVTATSSVMLRRIQRQVM